MTPSSPERSDTNSRAIRIEGDLAFIPLTQGREAVIDAVDAPSLAGRRWNYQSWYGKKHYCVGRLPGQKKSIALHRLLLAAPQGLHVDHIDGDGLNNRRANLRLATPAQNLWNTGPWPSNTSGHKGVSWRADRGKWQVHIRVGSKRLSLGHFSDIEQAAEAYASAARKYHGEFANVDRKGIAALSAALVSGSREDGDG